MIGIEEHYRLVSHAFLSAALKNPNMSYLSGLPMVDSGWLDLPYS